MESPDPAAREAWTNRLPLPNGLSLYLPSPDMLAAAEYVRDEIFIEQQYFRKGFEIQSTDAIMDIGANMGVFVLWAAPQAPQGRIIAVEPTHIMECLQLNVRLNGLKNVSTIRAAAGTTDGEMEIVHYPGFNIVSHEAGFRRPLFARLRFFFRFPKYRIKPVRERSSCLSMGRILDEHSLDRVNFLKIDCEGGEYGILKGMSARDWARIDRIAMEFHEYHRDHKYRELVAILRREGFSVDVEMKFVDYHLMHFGTIWARRP